MYKHTCIYGYISTYANLHMHTYTDMRSEPHVLFPPAPRWAWLI